MALVDCGRPATAESNRSAGVVYLGMFLLYLTFLWNITRSSRTSGHLYVPGICPLLYAGTLGASMNQHAMTSEIEEFISRENRSHAHSWLREVTWSENERSLVLQIAEPPSGDSFDPNNPRGLLTRLTRSRSLWVYFPANMDAKPFCYCEDDSLAPAAESANERLRPYMQNSILAIVNVVLQCVKRVTLGDQPRLSSRTEDDARALMAAEDVLTVIRGDPLGADLALALFSMAMSSYRRDTISTPFPKQLESEGRKRPYAALISSLKAVPSMLEVTSWTEAKQLLQLPAIAVFALHFVLVYLPTKLRAAKSEGSSCPANGEASMGAPPTGTAPSAAGVGKERGCGRLGDAPSYAFDVMLPSDPTFDTQVRLKGSTVAYHGSSPENFHSILNSGLRVMSGSRLMKHGAMLGHGIYLSSSQAAAACFALRGDGTETTVWQRSAFGTSDKKCVACTSNVPTRFRFRIVAKCRIINGDGVKVDGAGGEESYFVVTDSSKVRVEGFLLFDQGSPNPFQPEITSAITREHCVPRASAKKLKIPGTANGGRGRGVNSRRTPEVQQPARRQGQWLQGFSSKFWAFLRQHHVIIPVLALCLIIFGLSCAPNTGLR